MPADLSASLSADQQSGQSGQSEQSGLSNQSGQSDAATPGRTPRLTHDHDDSAHDEPHPLPLIADWINPGRLPKTARGTATFPLSVLPALSSNPGAPVTIFLDFDGHLQTRWGGVMNIRTPAFSLDRKATTFTATELAAIEEIFARVAEDYAPFDINVTTVEPTDIVDGQAVRIAIGGRYQDWYRVPSGGVAFINSFTNPRENTVYVFSHTLGDIQKVAEASSHEAGHAFGLLHQSAYDSSGRRTQEYATGNASGAPIMGVSYGDSRSRWWNGTSSSATTMQDDLATLTRSGNGITYRLDDHGDDRAAATELHWASVNESAGVASGRGIIERSDDVDVFLITISTAGDYRLDFHAASAGANLDARVLMQAVDGPTFIDETLIRVDSLSLGLRDLPVGDFLIQVSSDGTYGSLGQYAVSLQASATSGLPPTTPQGFTGQQLSPLTAAFEWEDTLGERGYELRGERQVGRETSRLTISLPPDSQSYTLQHSSSLGGWRFTLVARNDAGTASTDSIGLAAIPLVSPAQVVVTPFDARSFAVTWETVPGALSYTVSIATAEAPETPLQPRQVIEGTRAAAVISGLTAGHTYLITVTANNGRDVASSVTAPVQLTSPPTGALQESPRIESVIAEGNFLTASWSAVAGATQYVIQHRIRKSWITVAVTSESHMAFYLVEGDPVEGQPSGRLRVLAGNGVVSVPSSTFRLKRALRQAN